MLQHLTLGLRRCRSTPYYTRPIFPCSRSYVQRAPQSKIPARNTWAIYSTYAILFGGITFVSYQSSESFRHTILAGVRCSRVAGAAISSAIDYKVTMMHTYPSKEEEDHAFSECHTRSANRVLKALLANGGVFIKMGQHMASIIVLPEEWRNTMAVLQDKCEPTEYEALEALFMKDMGHPISELFSEFDSKPVGVASLAQVHVGRYKETGERVAVKLQHPHLAEFCNIDMEMVDFTLGWIKYWFPEFELTWLGEEMRTNLPKEMDFIHESENAARTVKEFQGIRTSLYIPKVIVASKRVLIMEYINGGRVDDLDYLARNEIDRNKVAIELSRIFNRMVFLHGWFHAARNLLIRPAPTKSKSPYNFEIVLLDHGLYFDLDPALRENYSRLWLSLIETASPSVIRDRRKYAELVGNIGPDLYPVFEAAITGRVALEGSWEDLEDSDFRRASSVIDMTSQTEQEKDMIRNAVLQRQGVILSVFDVLRRIPRRILMVLKLNDLTRSLDHSLKTTHSNIRIFLVMAKYCTDAAWRADRQRFSEELKKHKASFLLTVCRYLKTWVSYRISRVGLSFTECYLDLQGFAGKNKAWFSGLRTRGLQGAHKAAYGLDVE